MVKPTSCSSTNCKLVAFLGYSKTDEVSYAVAYNEISTSSGVGDKGYIVGYEEDSTYDSYFSSAGVDDSAINDWTLSVDISSSYTSTAVSTSLTESIILCDSTTTYEINDDGWDDG